MKKHILAMPGFSRSMAKCLAVVFVLIVTLSYARSALAIISFSQSNFRFRNDDGSQTTATWMAAQNTSVALGSANQHFRIRFMVQDDIVGSFTPEIQYIPALGNTCTSAGFTQITNSASNAFAMYVSPNFIDQSPTTQQLTGGLNAFEPGEILDATNPAPLHTFSATNYTEYEWAIYPTSAATAGASYLIRVSNNGAAMGLYSNCAQVTVYSPPAPSFLTSLSGWAWSSNIGWISFNSTDSGAGGGAAYSVSISTTTVGSTVVGTFSGYAWSPNIGWISFAPGDVALAPACGPAAQVILSDSSGGTAGTVTGWVRAVSGIGSSAWDGCIQLSDNGSVPLYHDSPHILGNKGVTYQTSGSTGLFNGFAWDSGAIGWLNFAPGFGLNVTIPSSSVGGGMTVSCTNNSVSNPTISFQATASGGTGPYTYTWIFGDGLPSQNIANPSVTYAQQSTSQTYYPTVSVSDSAGHTSSGDSCGNFTIAGSGGGGPSGNLKLMITNGGVTPPSGYFGSSFSSLEVRQNQVFNLGMNVNLTSDYAGGCRSSVSGGSWPAWTSADLSTLGNGTSQYEEIPSITASTPGSYTFILTCNSLSNPTVSSPVNLIVTSASEGEI